MRPSLLPLGRTHNSKIPNFGKASWQWQLPHKSLELCSGALCSDQSGW